ncbi:biofilm-forming protein [Gracilibacillus sp. D59]
MAKKGIQNSSIEQLKKDHESETAFNTDNPIKQKKKKDR